MVPHRSCSGVPEELESQSARLLAGSALTEFRNEPAGHLGGIRSHLDLLRVQLEGVSLSLDQAGGDGAGGRAQPGTTGDRGTALR